MGGGGGGGTGGLLTAPFQVTPQVWASWGGRGAILRGSWGILTVSTDKS